jgi:carboxyl-terminal processing protease
MIRRLALMAAGLALAGLAFAQPMTAEQKKAVLDGVSSVISERAFVPGVDFSKWPEFVAKRQEAVDKAENVAAFASAVNQSLREFGFSHIRLLSPRAEANRGRTSQIGLGAAFRPHAEGLQVQMIRDNAPAATAGIKTGEIILTVDGAPAKESTQLEGDEGKKLKLMIKSAEGQTRELEVELKRFSTVREETLTWVDEETAVLRVFTFSAGYGRERIEKLMTEAAKAKRLVLDLRSNGGGAVNNLNHLLSLLLPPETAYGTFVSKTAYEGVVKPGETMALTDAASAITRKASTRARTVPPFAGKVAVLINRGSASASEIAAAALKENSGAVLVGSRTAGAVLASTFRRLPEGFSLQYPVSDYVTIKGVRLEGNPLLPDAESTERPAEGQPDPAVVKAVELLKAAG